MRWTVFCRVVDNFGDVGFAWRLAADLGGRGEHVRLAVDDAGALAWMAPDGAARVEVVEWSARAAAGADVLVETFGCGWPEGVSGRIGVAPVVPLRVNVEHLSAESYVERSHGLPSPAFDAAGLPDPTWYFYPGFSARTGGLLREPGLLDRRRQFGDGRGWLAGRGFTPRAGERVASLFCYMNPALDAMLDALACEPTLLLLAPGAATEQATALLGPGLARGRLRAARLPALAQADFDRLLWSCDLNFVRGEDSLVRAIWAGAPFVWQIYPQDDGAHSPKLAAFLDRMLAAASPPLQAALRALFDAWNGPGGAFPQLPAPGSPIAEGWAAQARRWCHGLAAQADLTTSLLDFVASKR
jgi:uncharacterized repeat protein (TIGR03837 family)